MIFDLDERRAHAIPETQNPSLTEVNDSRETLRAENIQKYDQFEKANKCSDISAEKLALGLNHDWAELLSVIRIKSLRHSISALANERELGLAIRAMNARHKIRVNSAILKMKSSEIKSPSAGYEPLTRRFGGL